MAEIGTPLFFRYWILVKEKTGATLRAHPLTEGMLSTL
jgi:hypothetical protein